MPPPQHFNVRVIAIEPISSLAPSEAALIREGFLALPTPTFSTDMPASKLRVYTLSNGRAQRRVVAPADPNVSVGVEVTDLTSEIGWSEMSSHGDSSPLPKLEITDRLRRAPD